MRLTRWIVVGLAVPFFVLSPPKDANALIHVIGDIYCQGLVVNGIFEGYGVCYDMSRPAATHDWYNPIGWGGGGGGGSHGIPNAPVVPGTPDHTQRDISGKLDCAIQEYSTIRPGSKPAPMKMVNTYAFAKPIPGTDNYEYHFSNSPVLPTNGTWTHVGGTARFADANGLIYKAGTLANTVNFTGINNGVANYYKGNMTAFEMQLYTAAHELVHLKWDGAPEALAVWHGIETLKNWQRDNGAECTSGSSNPK